MSERASFTSEYMYNTDDYNRIRNALDCKSKHLCIAAPAKWGNNEMPIVQGKVGSLSLGLEWLTLVDALRDVFVVDEEHFIVISDYNHHATRIVLRPSGDIDVYPLAEIEKYEY